MEKFCKKGFAKGYKNQIINNLKSIYERGIRVKSFMISCSFSFIIYN